MRAPTTYLAKPFSPLYGPDVRMSNPSFNSEQNEFQIDINPTNSQYAIGSPARPRAMRSISPQRLQRSTGGDLRCWQRPYSAPKWWT